MLSSEISDMQVAASFKVILVGESGVGKSSVLTKYTDNYFVENTTVTFLDRRIKYIQQKDNTFQMELWDTAGQEKYRSFVITYFKLSKAACVVFALNDLKTLDKTRYWLDLVKQNCGDIVLVLIGNKADQVQGNLAELLLSIATDIQSIQSEFHCKFFVSSAKSGEGITEIFEYVFKELYRKWVPVQEVVVKPIKLPSAIKNPKPKPGCC